MRHSIARDGIVAGILGATAVALWFLGLDTLYRHPLATPGALGRGLMRILGPEVRDGTAVFVAVYTVFHYVAFIAVGLLVAVIVHFAEREPGVLAGAMMLFVALGWAQVATGNLIAAIVMGVYMWRTHPGLGRNLKHALSGGTVRG